MARSEPGAAGRVDLAAEVRAVLNPYKTLRSVIRFRRIETNRVERRLARAASIEDLRRIAKRRLPGGVFDYIDGGAEDERTLAANSAAFAAVSYRPRVLRGVWGGGGTPPPPRPPPPPPPAAGAPP